MVTESKRVANADREANRGRWQAELDAWRGSGKALSTWARERGLSRDALQYWKKKYSVTVRKPLGKLTLIPVPRTTASEIVRETRGLPVSSGVPIELHIGERRLILATGFDANSLRIVLDVLGSRC